MTDQNSRMPGRKPKHAERPAANVNGKRLVYFVTEDWYFCSHRLPLAVAAREAGYAVTVVTRVKSHEEEIRSSGIDVVPIDLSRRSKNPVTEVAAIRRLTQIFKRLNPDIVHNVALKPVIYGSIAARLARVQHVVNAMAGLGYIYSSESATARTLRPFVKTSMRTLLNNGRTKVILQNPDDVEVICNSIKVPRERIVLIRGSGVDIEEYGYSPEAEGVPIVMLASRLLWDKGIAEFVHAARMLKAKGKNARFVLVGDTDDANPASIAADTLDAWSREGNVELWGHRKNMPNILAQANVVCLPSYREGVPKVLIEAASCGRAIITTDAPGCREIVRHGENGFLVPIRDAKALADAIGTLLDDPALRSRMGRAGREIVRKEFAVDTVVSATLGVYEKMLEGAGH